MAGVVGMHDQINFKTREALEDYVANEIARFIKAKEFEISLTNDPTEIKELYYDYLEEDPIC